MQLSTFNSLDRARALEALDACLFITRWATEIVDARAFDTHAHLLTFATRAAEPFTTEEIETAMSRHPRIGEKHSGASQEAEFSHSEQSGVDAQDTDIAARLAEGNRKYEARFDRVFLIRAANRSAPEILKQLTQRLTHTDAQEDRIVAEQLREIALLRLERTVTP